MLNRVNGSTTVSVAKKKRESGQDYQVVTSSQEDDPAGVSQRVEAVEEVRFSQGRTINFTNYEFARITVTYSAHVASDALEAAEAVVRELLEREVAGASSIEREDHPIVLPEGAQGQRIGMDYGLTINLDNFESGKVDVGITLPVGDDSSLEDVIAELQRRMTARIGEEKAKLQGLDGADDIGL